MTTAALLTGSIPDTLREQLAPVRAALVGDAEAEADRILSSAKSSADDVVAEATAQADAEVERARHRAELAAQANAEQVLARVRSEGHRAVLVSQQQLRQRLIDEVHASVEELRNDPRYPALVDHLEALARTQLGDEAVIEHVPAGGIVAEANGRRVDYRLTALVDRALETLDDEVAALWG